MWTADREWAKVASVSRSSIVFYGAIGLINAAIFLAMSAYGQQLFNLTEAQLPLYRQMMVVLAFSTVLNWLSGVAIQLLSAMDELGFINRVAAFSSVLNFAVALVAIQWHWDLITSFIGYPLATLMPIPLYVWRRKVCPVPRRSLLPPRWDGAAFRERLMYSVAIRVMGLSHLTANNLRPLLLGKL